MLFYTLSLFLGLCIGSFLNALIWRIYNEESIVSRRSYCPKCQKQLKSIDLIPVLSFLFLGRKCRWCKNKISWQYPLVELATGLLFLTTAIVMINKIDLQTLTGQLTLLLFWYFIAILVFIFVFDVKYYLIPDNITLPSIIIILLANILLHKKIPDLFLGALIAGGFFWLQYIIPPLGRKLFQNKYAFFKPDWIGGGDVKLGILMGVMLGWKMTLVALALAYILGSIVGIGLILAKKKEMSSKLPFGTFLSVASVLTLLWGEEILQWYLKMNKF